VPELVQHQLTACWCCAGRCLLQECLCDVSIYDLKTLPIAAVIPDHFILCKMLPNASQHAGNGTSKEHFVQQQLLLVYFTTAAIGCSQDMHDSCNALPLSFLCELDAFIMSCMTAGACAVDYAGLHMQDCRGICCCC
jgi:hypothetical protein